MKHRSFLAMPILVSCGLIAFALVTGPRAEAQLSGLGISQRGAAGNPGVLPPHSNAFGKTYGEWSAQFWQWLYSLPADQHPLFDTADCSTGQSGKVWFLGGTFTTVELAPDVVVGMAERDCRVPPGKALFFPIVNAECNTDDYPAATEEDLRACARFLADHIQNLQVSVDGRELTSLDRYRTESPFFMFGPLPDNNVIGADSGLMFDSVGDGVYIMLAPLSRGEHTIHFSGEAEFTFEDDGFDFLFQLDIRYHISVAKGR